MEAQRKEREVVLRDGDGLGESGSAGNSDLIARGGDGEDPGFDEEFAEEFRRGARLESVERGGEEEEEEEFEFEFVCENPDGLIISAEDAFEDGQIRPFYPLFGRNILLDEDASRPGSPSASSSALRGFLLEERMRNPAASSSSSSSDDVGDPLEGLAEGTYCVWGKGKPTAETEAACRKSNSTGFSRLWRVKDLVLRSNSDGKDAFVFLNQKKPKDNNATTTQPPPPLEMNPAPKPSSSKASASASSTGTPKKEGRQRSHGYPARTVIDKNRRRSYLPYKVGFFTNINGMSRNVHPY